jgi:flagellar motor switch protein FliG
VRLGHLLDDELLVWFFRKERPQTTAAFLSLQDPAHSSRILSKFEASLGAEIARCLAVTVTLDPPALVLMLEELNKIAQSSDHSRFSSGAKNKEKLAEVLRQMPIAQREQLLAKIAEKDPDLEKFLKNSMLTVQRILTLPAQTLSVVIGRFSDDELALLLRNLCASEKGLLLGCLSKGRQSSLLEKVECLPPQLASKLAEVEGRIVEVAQELQRSGRIVFPWDGEYV